LNNKIYFDASATYLLLDAWIEEKVLGGGLFLKSTQMHLSIHWKRGRLDHCPESNLLILATMIQT